MRPFSLFVVGLIFLSAALLAVGVIFYRTKPSRGSNTSSVPGDVLQFPTSTLTPSGTPAPPATPTPSATQIPSLELAVTASPLTYNRVGQTITYTFVITNTGNTPVTDTQFVIYNNTLPNPIACGASDTTLAPDQSLTCSVVYTITRADLESNFLKRSWRTKSRRNSSTSTTIVNTSGFTSGTLPPPSEISSSTPTSTAITPHPPVSETANSTPTPITIMPTPLPTFIIEAEWPEKLDVSGSDLIRISLIRIGDNIYLPTVEVAGHKASVSTAINVGTPGVNPQTAMGSGYDVFVKTDLKASAFDIDLTSIQEQSFDQSRIDWIWNISPRKEKVGRQTITVEVYIYWKPKNSDSAPIQRKIWSTSPAIYIDVYQPLITTGQLNIFAIVSGSVGSGLSAPFVYGIIIARRGKPQQKRKGKSPRR